MNQPKHNRDCESIRELAVKISRWLKAPVTPVSSSKKPYCKNWPRLTPRKSITPTALSAFIGDFLNIGVVLGKWLITIDCDDDEFRHELLALNPCLSETLISQGSRVGCNFWLRIKGMCPGPKQLRIFRAGEWKNVGEWRSEGNCTVIAGYHAESGRNYEHNGKDPITLEFSELKWPKGMSPFNPEIGWDEELFTERTEEDGRDRNDTDDVNRPSSAVIGSVQEAVRLCTPAKRRSTDKLMFKFCRALKTLERHRGSPLDKQELNDAFKAWYDAALPFLRNEPLSRYRAEFFYRFDQAKAPLGHARLLKRALHRADTCAPPSEAEQFADDALLKRLVSLLYCLQIEAGDQWFWISSRDCGRLLGVSHTEAARWIKVLASDHYRILKIVRPHTSESCPRYRWMGSLPGGAKSENPDAP